MESFLLHMSCTALISQTAALSHKCGYVNSKSQQSFVFRGNLQYELSLPTDQHLH